MFKRGALSGISDDDIEAEELKQRMMTAQVRLAARPKRRHTPAEHQTQRVDRLFDSMAAQEMSEILGFDVV